MVRILERQLVNQQRVHHAKNRATRTNAQSRDQNRENRERLVAPQRAQRILHVLAQHFHERQSPAVSIFFSQGLTPSHSQNRLAPRFLRRHPRFFVFRREQIPMGLELG